MILEKSWRWFGDTDIVQLSDLKEIGVEGVVTALYDLKPGVVWPSENILDIKSKIEQHNMIWNVVESLPVSEDIKLGTSKRKEHVENYMHSLFNLAESGTKLVCYNFMPVLDWVRTDLAFCDNDGTETMLYDHVVFAVFDLYILKRENALNDYPEHIVQNARVVYASMSEQQKEQLAFNIIITTQGFVNSAVEVTDNYIELFLNSVEQYKNITTEKYRNNLAYFLNAVMPTAEKFGIRLCVHPDDPPFPLLGLPRVASTIDDFEWIFSCNSSPANGLTFCTGSLAARKDNDLLRFIEKFGPRIHFAHLRNLKFLSDHRFYESGHLDGDIDMYAIIKLLIKEQNRRESEGHNNFRIPFRPDHGKKMLFDFSRESNPGYPLLGRMRGLSEINGMQIAIDRMLNAMTRK